MFFKKKIKNIEGSCFDCQHAKSSSVGSDVVCNYYGIISSTGICKKYKKNLLAQRPPKKRGIDTSYSPEDFSIE